jgi:hypothetical protein
LVLNAQRQALRLAVFEQVRFNGACKGVPYDRMDRREWAPKNELFCRKFPSILVKFQALLNFVCDDPCQIDRQKSKADQVTASKIYEHIHSYT